jgi:competence protein ComEC
MILGYRERIGDEISTPFRLTNTMHILAISGLHVGFFFLVVNTLFKLLRIPERVASLIALPLIALYAALTGAAVPVIRASVMFMSFLAAPFLNRQRDALNSLGTAALIILAINPLQLSDIGFQLSFGAVLAILLFSSPIAGCLHRVWPCCALQGQLDVSQWEKLRWRAGRTAIAFCATSTAAWIGLAPLIAHVFHLISLLSLLGNMVVIPAGFAVVCLGFAGAIGSLFSTGLAWCANRLNCFVVWLMLAGVRCVARIPWSWRGVAESGASSVLLHYTVIACAASALIGRWRAGGRLTLLCLAGGLLLLPVAFARDESRLQIVFLDVGQGDATYVEFPGGANMLIDGGPATAPPAGASVVWPFLQSRGRCDVDAVVLTHPHDDHVSGLFKVLSECSVDRLVVADWGDPPAPYRKLLELAREKGVRICRVRRGDVFAWGDGLRVTVLNPGRTLHRGTASDFNNNSIALRIEYGQVRILIAADMEAEAEADLCRSGLRLAADALRVGHHGGAASSTAEFVRRVSPRWAVVSAGENNRFDHPSPKALARLRGAGCRLFRTDLHGSVMLSTDGTTADVTPFP